MSEVAAEPAFESHTLSKKEQRLLKKAEKKLNGNKSPKKAKEVEPEEKEADEVEAEEVEEPEEDVDLHILEESDDDDEDVPYSDVELEEDADVVPHTKVTMNNSQALAKAYERIKLDWEKYPFTESQAITYSAKVESQITDIYDDTERELQFFKQGLDAATEGRKKLQSLKVPFSRPSDYFAEMVKSDEHMEKLRLKLVGEASEKKAKEDAKRQRQLKKFGKQVQHETLQQRQKDKRETLDRIKDLRKKRKNDEINDDAFDVAVEEASGGKEEVSRKKRSVQHKVRDKSGGNKKTQRPGKSKRRHWKK